MWQQGFSAGTQNQAASVMYCASLALDGGGWRLPTVDELRSIVDPSRILPAIDTSFFPGTPSAVFWSSSPVAGLPSYGWGVTFAGSVVNYATGVAERYRARCLR